MIFMYVFAFAKYKIFLGMNRMEDKVNNITVDLHRLLLKMYSVFKFNEQKYYNHYEYNLKKER